MYVIKRISGYSKGRYMAVGLVNTTSLLSEAHTFEVEGDAQVMAHPKYEVIVNFDQEKSFKLKADLNNMLDLLRH
jgi:hypothetical protein